MYKVIKRYGHEEGWSCTYRQWRANSHCQFIHGYSLAFEFEFECQDLDDRDWCVDFGSLKTLKAWLQHTFDHKMLVAKNDPKLELFMEMASQGLSDPVIVESISCEKFAEMAFIEAQTILENIGQCPRASLVSVRVSEHLGNTAVYCPPYKALVPV